MCGNGSAVILRIKTVGPSLELQIFYVQHGKKRVMEYTFCFSLSSGREEFLGIGKMHQGKSSWICGKIFTPGIPSTNISQFWGSKAVIMEAQLYG